MSDDRNKGLTAKEYLGQLEVIDTKIQQMLEELDDLMTDSTSTGGIDYSKERVQTSGSKDSLGDTVVRYVSLNDTINAEIDEFADIKHKVIKEIQSLNVKNYIEVLFKVYVQYKSIKVASDEMKMSYQYARNIHKKALEAFEKRYNNLRYLT